MALGRGSGDATLALTCGDQTFPLVVPAGVAQAALPQQQITAATTCTVVETTTGAARGTEVDTSAVLTVDGVPRPLALGEPFDVAPGQAVAVAVTNAFVDPVPPPAPQPPPVAEPQPPVPGGTGGAGGFRSAVLADTGADGTASLVLLAGQLLLAGSVLAVTARGLRQRWRSRAAGA